MPPATERPSRSATPADPAQREAVLLDQRERAARRGVDVGAASGEKHRLRTRVTPFDLRAATPA